MRAVLGNKERGGVALEPEQVRLHDHASKTPKPPGFNRVVLYRVRLISTRLIISKDYPSLHTDQGSKLRSFSCIL